MSIACQCPDCGQKYKVPDTAAGKKAKCQKCSGTLSVPFPELQQNPFSGVSDMSSLLDEDLDSAMAQSAASAKSDSSTTLAPLPKHKPQRAPKTSRSREIDPKKAQWRFSLSATGVILGGILILVGYRDYRLAAASKTTPQKISVAELVANGPGDNIYLELTGLDLLVDQSVVESQSPNLQQTHWTYVWIPAVSQQPGVQGNVVVIVGTNQCHNEAELMWYARQTTLTGLIVNETDSLGTEERDLLSEGLPGVDVDSCYFFRAGQKPGSAQLQFLLLGGGSILALISLPVLVYEARVFLPSAH